MNNNHGSVIKEIRKLRGISQQQLGQLIGSQSMVSRIENNKAEPSDHTLLLLCHALNISFDEYFDMVYGTHASDTERLFDFVSQAYKTNNQNDLKKLYISSLQAIKRNPDDVSLFHKYMVVKATLYHLDFKLTTELEQNRLIDYFFQVPKWQYYDLRILEHTLYVIDVDKIKPYITEIIYQDNFDHFSEAVSNTVGQIIINLLEASIMQKKYHVTKYLLTQVPLWQPKSKNFKFQTWLLFWTGFFEQQQNITANTHEKIEQAYQIATYVDSQETLKMFDRLLKLLHH